VSLAARADRPDGFNYQETFLIENGQAQVVRINRAEGLKRE
jgi:hypothetical protein